LHGTRVTPVPALGQDETLQVFAQMHETFWPPTGRVGAPHAQRHFDEVHRGYETDPRRRHTGLGGDALAFEPNDVVGQREPPQFLRHTLGALAARRFFAIEHHALDLVVAKLDLPSLVLERADFVRGIPFG